MTTQRLFITTVLLHGLSSGCVFISDGEHAERRAGVLADSAAGDTGSVDPVDGDGDGYTDDVDCDDSDDAVHPGADELCNGVDDDCDGTVDVDASDASTWYLDGDGDGFGVGADTVEACQLPSGYAAQAGDCDDLRPAVNPEADELCNGIDDDCDDAVDDDPIDMGVWYTDSDGDGYGDYDSATRACEGPSGTVDQGGDCDEADASINPGASEVCDGVDNDCDGSVDNDALDATTWYMDADGDGYGDDDRAVVACEQPSRHVALGGDCSDGSARINPAGTETCDGVDEDCDGSVDEPDAVDAATWYSDVDGDGYGDPSGSTVACEAPSGAVAEDGDCDDADPGINPGASEVCDGVDNDCDGDVDGGAADASTWYADVDGDGYGDATASSSACTQPTGFVGDSSDCDDGAASVNPGAAETCDGVDDDCDGTVDEPDAVDASTWYADVDGDGYGDGGSASVACSAPAGTVVDATDCDDGDAGVNPGAAEYCDGVDQDCDGVADDDALDMGTWYADVDGDGYGDPGSYVVNCEGPSGSVLDGGDCDDGDAGVNPGASELCDGVDQDCDGSVDEEATDGSTWYLDGDGDGFGDASAGVVACAAPSATVADSSDCDDGDADVNPAASELCNGIDDDCDGAVDRAGLVTFWDHAGAVTDASASFASGSSHSAASISLSDDGTLVLCAGSYDVELNIHASDLTIQGLAGSGSTTLQGDGSDSVIDVNTSVGTLVLEGLTITGGSDRYGGGLYANGSGVLLAATDCVFEGNDADRGGGLYAKVAAVGLDSCSFVNNSATADGGGLYADAELALTGVSFSLNTAGDEGGGAYVRDASSAVFTECIFEGNVAEEYGGGAELQDSSVEFHGSTFDGNIANTGGGGLSFRRSTALMEACDVLGNTAQSWSGGIHLSASSLDLVSSLVSENELADSGVYAAGGGAMLYDGSTLVCTGSSSEVAGFLANSAGDGGGVYVYDSTSRLDSIECDWGTGSDDNDPDDVDLSPYGSSYDYGDDESFSCDGGLSGNCL